MSEPTGVSSEVGEHLTLGDALIRLREQGAIREGWFCNSRLAPRCTEESRDRVRGMFGGHDTCQTLAFVVPVAALRVEGEEE